MPTSRPATVIAEQATSDRDFVRRHLVVLALSGAAVFLFFLHGELADWGGDNVTFLVLAEALGAGDGYVNAQLPEPTPHMRYPPGLPLLLVPLVAANSSVYGIKCVLAAISLLGLLLAYLLIRRLGSARTALLVTFGTLTSAVFLDPALSVLSDGLYFALSMGALLLFDRALRSPDSRWHFALIAGVLAGLAGLTRTAGLVLGPAMLISILAARSARPWPVKLRTLVLAGGVWLLLTVPWVVRVTGDDTGGSYVSQSRNFQTPQNNQLTLLERPVHNVQDLVDRVYRLPLPPALEDSSLAKPVRGVFAGMVLLAGGLALLGALHGVLRRRSVIDFYAAAYCTLLVFWIGGGPRLWMPILPFFLIWMLDGLFTALHALSRKPVRGLIGEIGSTRWRTAALIGWIAVQLVVMFGSERYQRRLHGVPNGWWHEYRQAVSALGARAQPGELAFAPPNVVPYYFHGIQSATLNRGCRTPDEIVHGLEQAGARYVIDSPFLLHRYGDRVTRAIATRPERFDQIGQFGRVRLYSFLDAGDRP